MGCGRAFKTYAASACQSIACEWLDVFGEKEMGFINRYIRKEYNVYYQLASLTN